MGLKGPLLCPFYTVTHGPCLKVTSVWKLATLKGTPFPSLESRFLESLPISVNDIWNEEK